MGENRNVILDDSAQKLFEELGGIEKRKKYKAGKPDRLAESLQAEQRKLDNQRVWLIKAIHLLSSYFLDARFLKSADTEKDLFQEFVQSLTKLSDISAKNPTILVRLRGFPSDPNTAENVDYEILCGSVTVDFDIIPGIIKRLGFRMSHLSDQARRAFGVLLDQGLYNIYLELPGRMPAKLQQLRSALQIISRFGEAAKAGEPIVFERKGRQARMPVIFDEKSKPDPNLTLVAGLNGLKPEAMRALVNKIDAWMQRSAAKRSGQHYISIFNAIYGVKSLRQKLLKPPIEVNSVRWLMADQEQEVFSKEKAHVAKLVVENYGHSPQQTVRVLKSVYGNDFDRINSQHLGQRLHLSSNLLTTIGKKPQDQEIKNEVMGNIKTRLELVRDEVYEDLQIGPTEDRDATDPKASLFGRLHTRVHKMVSFFKRRSSTRQKMKTIVYKAINFDAQDYDTLAKDFDISVDDAKDLIEMLKECFNAEGRFIRGAFARIMPAFAPYERKVFEFLWHYLKEAIHQKDRIAFLNSLQVLTARMQQPKRAFRILLADFCRQPDRVGFSDSKALMLAILIIRKYNKELIDIEITPEDVLLVKEELDKEVAKYAAWKIDQDQEKFFEKIQTVHVKLKEVLDAGDPSAQPIPLRYLMGLEREAYIFLTLIGGNTSHSVLTSAIQEYGNPQSEMYRLKQSQTYLHAVLQNLRVVIRGLGRVGRSVDLAALNEIRTQSQAFIQLGQGSKHEEAIINIMQWVEKSRESILQKGG
ncbi:MAG: hypothetical protein ABFS43_11715 [Thermodesulfobacteriota bacterium]